MLLLQFTDTLWKDHLLALDRLRQGVGLRGYGQRNPLLEYKKEALQMYLMMSAMRDEQVVTRLFHTEMRTAQAAAEAPGKSTARGLERGTFRPAAEVLGSTPSQPAVAVPTEPPPAPPVPELVLPPSDPQRLPARGDEARLFAHRYGIRRNDPCPC